MNYKLDIWLSMTNIYYLLGISLMLKPSCGQANWRTDNTFSGILEAGVPLPICFIHIVMNFNGKGCRSFRWWSSISAGEINCRLSICSFCSCKSSNFSWSWSQSPSKKSQRSVNDVRTRHARLWLCLFFIVSIWCLCLDRTFLSVLVFKFNFLFSVFTYVWTWYNMCVICVQYVCY